MSPTTTTALLLMLLAVLPVCSAGQAVVVPGHTEAGIASYYHDRFHGRMTASGERFDQGALTAAHRTLPFGTTVRVTRKDNGTSVVVRINDRGPFRTERIIDLSRTAAGRLGMLDSGLVQVSVEVIRLPAARD
ncbi:septal ring lytic transglycosylase RlpA family protein [Thioalkalivibrio sp.]|uniref:septal ring lytic transglycosylase RlpA family protein n=1 Tax=Thioalkalivibrio sp. TaxID=2093813 RepID=UPI003568869A